MLEPSLAALLDLTTPNTIGLHRVDVHVNLGFHIYPRR